jgi:hypothetical protein
MCRGVDVGRIIAYEQGTLDLDDTIHLFADLIRTGDAWTLQGHYGRTAAALIQQGVIDKFGNVLTLATEE